MVGEPLGTQLSRRQRKRALAERITIIEAADILGISRRAIRAMAARRGIPPAAAHPFLLQLTLLACRARLMEA
jgi:hypothetical protein